MTVEQELKVKENQIRRKLKRMGYILKKSRRKDPDAYDYGGYMILDLWSGVVMFASDPIPYCLTIEDVEEIVAEAKPIRPKKGK